MAKEKQIDFEKLKPLFSDEDKREVFGNKTILKVVSNPLTLQEIPPRQRLSFWTLVFARMVKSPEFRREVLETLKKVEIEE